MRRFTPPDYLEFSGDPRGLQLIRTDGFLAEFAVPPTTRTVRIVPATDGTLVTPDHLCPDLLRHENIGAADGPRGRVVRAFFWLMRAWPPRR